MTLGVSPTVGSYEVGVSYERGTPVEPGPKVERSCRVDERPKVEGRPNVERRPESEGKAPAIVAAHRDLACSRTITSCEKAGILKRIALTSWDFGTNKTVRARFWPRLSGKSHSIFFPL